MTRELVTIGDLRAAGPAARSRARRADYLRMIPRSIGATNTAFAPGVTPDTASGALQDDAVSLLNYLDTHGVPSEHVNDPNVEAFQTAWNADPGNAGGNAKLSVDGGYGPNTHDALNAVVGGTAPNVNTGSGPAPHAPAVTPTPTPGTTPHMSGGGMLLLLGAALVGGYLLFGRKKGARASVIIHKNPRRRAASRRLAL
jgi:hypothetical protein